jgi:hypothetical protein
VNVISITQLIPPGLSHFIRLILIRLNSFRLQTAAQVLHSFGRLITIVLAAKLIYRFDCPLFEYYTTVSSLYLLYPTDVINYYRTVNRYESIEDCFIISFLYSYFLFTLILLCIQIYCKFC